jgi:glycosyltransferase involved in cell wall biosynthesis
LERRKLKVLHADNAYSHTGGNRALLEYCVAQKNEIDSVVVIVKGSACKKLFEDAGIKVYEVPFVEIGKSIRKVFLYIPFLIFNGWTIKKIARKENIDVLHSNDIYNMTLYVTKYLFCYNKPLVVHVRLLPASYISPLYNVWKKIHLRFADRLIAVSNAVARAWGMPANMEVLYDVDANIEHYPPYNFPDRVPFRFLYLANYIVGKGQDYAIKALARLGEDGTHIHITFAGGLTKQGGPYMQALKKLVDGAGLESQVNFEGYIDAPEVFMKRFHGILNFSESESFSFTCYDALRFGIPLIATDSGGPSELFESGVSGILVPNKDVEKMAEAMLLLSTDSSLCRTFSLNSRAYIAQHINKKSGFQKISYLFKNLA